MSWTEGGGRGSVTYQGEQNLMNVENCFFGKENCEPIEVSKGVHLYKFSARIPKKVPASAEGKFGFIRYKVEVNLEIPFMPDLSAVEDFIVVTHEDLNNYPELKLPSEVEEVRTFCCFMCESEPLMIKLSTPQTGYALGDEVRIKIEIFNRSKTKFDKSMVTLNRIETFYSYTPSEKSKKFRIPLTAVISKGVDPLQNVNFTEAIHIPLKATVSNDRICNVFQVTYEVEFSMKQSKRSTAATAAIPVCVGNIALQMNSSISIFSESLPYEELRRS